MWLCGELALNGKFLKFYVYIVELIHVFVSLCPNVTSEITAEGRRITKLDQILLNGNNIAIVSMTCLFCLPLMKMNEKNAFN